MKLTPWFPKTVKPVRPGAYQVDYAGNYSYWTGDSWCLPVCDRHLALRIRQLSSIQARTWRGLAEEPK